MEPPAEPSFTSILLSIFNPLTMETVAYLLATCFLLCCSAMVSGSEVAYFSLTPKDMEDIESSNVSSDVRILSLLNAPKHLLATILIANNFINVAIVLLSTLLMDSAFNFVNLSGTYQFLIQVVAVTFLIVLIGEVIPKVYASAHGLILARFMSLPLVTMSTVFKPLSSPLAYSTSFIDKKIKRKQNTISVDELDQALELTYDPDESSDEEKKILKGIVKFGNTDVTQIMTARVDVTAVSVDIGFEELITTIKESGYSRIPVYKETFDQVVGILYIKDLLPYLHTVKENWQELIRSPFYVPENKKIDDLLKEFQEKKIHLAIVVDEYGGASGIVSLEDVIEEIVGDISDEFDDEDILYSKLDDNTFVFEGKTPLIDLYRVLEIEGDEFEKEKGESETIAGFILEKSGKILKKNERMIFGNYLFVVEAADKRKIKRVKLTINPEEPKVKKPRRLFNLILTLLVGAGLIGCNDAPIPKQKGHLRITLPTHHYKALEIDCPFRFEYPDYGHIVYSSKEKQENCWPDIYFPKLNAKIYLTYERVSSEEQLNQLLKDSHKLTYDHAVKASGIFSKRIDIDSSRVHALLFEVGGDVASNAQFIATDSVRNFLRGSLYFYTAPNSDSLQPVIDHLTEDLKHLVETLQWKNG